MKKQPPKTERGLKTRIRQNVLHTLVTDLWWFIENVNDETPDRNDRFFSLRERIREYQESLK